MKKKYFYTCKEVADRYSVSEDTVWRWIRNKKILAVKIGGTYRISAEALEQFEKGATS